MKEVFEEVNAKTPLIFLLATGKKLKTIIIMYVLFTSFIYRFMVHFNVRHHNCSNSVLNVGSSNCVLGACAN